jgi:hypothetical protein
MKHLSAVRISILAAMAWILMDTSRALGCAACFGKSDSALAQGMNMGIFALLAVIVSVLGSIAGFFIFVAKRSAKMASHSDSEQLPQTSNQPF